MFYLNTSGKDVRQVKCTEKIVERNARFVPFDTNPAQSRQPSHPRQAVYKFGLVTWISGRSHLASVLAQIGPKRDKSKTFKISSPNQNVLKLIFESPRFVPYGAKFDILAGHPGSVVNS